MRRRSSVAIVALFSAALLALPPAIHAQEKLHGKVTSTKMTSCNYPAGGCEGWMTVQSAGASKEAEDLREEQHDDQKGHRNAVSAGAAQERR